MFSDQSDDHSITNGDVEKFSVKLCANSVPSV